MKIVITAAGLGSRFKKFGIYTPVYKLKVKGKSIYEWAMLSLQDFFNEEFIFIFRTETFDKDFIEGINKNIGIKKCKFKIIDECTEGQATTAFKTSDLIKESESVIIYNINTYIIPGVITKENIDKDMDVFIPVYKEKHANYKKDLNEDIIAGLYYFRSWEDYIYIYSKYISYIKIKNKEACIEDMIDYLIKEGKIVETQLIPNECIYKLNTPQEVKIFTEKLN